MAIVNNNLNPMGLLNNYQPNNFVIDPMQVQQAQMQKQVDDAKTLSNRQRYGNMMLAFSDVLKGRDPSTGVLARQQHFATMKAAEEKRKQGLAMGESAYDYILKTTGNADMAMLAKNNPAIANSVLGSIYTPKKQTSSIQEYEYAKKNDGFDGTLNDFLVSQKATTNINTNMSGFQKSAVDNYNDSQDAAKDAMVINTSLDVIDNLLDKGIQTGFASGFDLGVQRIGQAIIGDNYKLPEVAGKEVFVAETTKLILPLVKQLGVNPTDKDLDFVRKGALELSKSVEGNKLMLASLRLSQNRKIDENNFNNQYYNKEPKATIFKRNIAFDEYKKSKPELYTSVSLIQAYDNLLLQQNSNNEIISSTEEAPFK